MPKVNTKTLELTFSDMSMLLMALERQLAFYEKELKKEGEGASKRAIQKAFNKADSLQERVYDLMNELCEEEGE